MGRVFVLALDGLEYDLVVSGLEEHFRNNVGKVLLRIRLAGMSVENICAR